MKLAMIALLTLTMMLMLADCGVFDDSSDLTVDPYAKRVSEWHKNFESGKQHAEQTKTNVSVGLVVLVAVVCLCPYCICLCCACYGAISVYMDRRDMRRSSNGIQGTAAAVYPRMPVTLGYAGAPVPLGMQKEAKDSCSRGSETK